MSAIYSSSSLCCATWKVWLFMQIWIIRPPTPAIISEHNFTFCNNSPWVDEGQCMADVGLLHYNMSKTNPSCATFGECVPCAAKNVAFHSRTLRGKCDMESNLTKLWRWCFSNLLVEGSGLFSLVPRLHGVLHLCTFERFGSGAYGVRFPPFWLFFDRTGWRPATNSCSYIAHHSSYFFHARNLNNVAHPPQYGAIGQSFRLVQEGNVLWVTPILLEHYRSVLVEHSDYRYHLFPFLAQILLVVYAPRFVVDSSIGLRHNLSFELWMQNPYLNSNSDGTLQHKYRGNQLIQVPDIHVLAESTSANLTYINSTKQDSPNQEVGTLTQFGGRLANWSWVMTDASICGVLCFFVWGLPLCILPLCVLLSQSLGWFVTFRFTGTLGSTGISSPSDSVPMSMRPVSSPSDSSPSLEVISTLAFFLERLFTYPVLQCTSLMVFFFSATSPSSDASKSEGHLNFENVVPSLGLAPPMLSVSSS